MRPVLLLALVALACSTERTETSLWTMHVMADACPEPEQARDPLIDDWGPPAHEIDGMHCSLEEVLAIDAAMARPDRPACCFAVDCTGAPGPEDQLRLFDASCVALECDAVEPDAFTAGEVTAALAADLPECRLASGGAGPVDTLALECVYPVTARYSCSSEPG